MKNGKRLTVKDHRYLQSINLASNNWLISKRTSEKWVLVHKLTGFTKVVPAP